MARNEGSNPKELRRKNYEGEKMNTSEKSKQKKEKSRWMKQLGHIGFGFIHERPPIEGALKCFRATRLQKFFLYLTQLPCRPIEEGSFYV